MAHETQHGSNPLDKKSVISFSSGIWLVIILVFLFIGALNFMQVESAPNEEGKSNTEMKSPSEKAGEKEQTKKSEAAPAESGAKKEEGKKSY